MPEMDGIKLLDGCASTTGSAGNYGHRDSRHFHGAGGHTSRAYDYILKPFEKTNFSSASARLQHRA